MDLMQRPARRTLAMRLHRRHAIVTNGGIDGVYSVITELRSSGHRVRDFTADVHEGVGLSSLTCTVSLTDAECDPFVDQLQQVPSVVSVEPC